MPAAARAESEAGARPYFKRSYATLRAGPRRGARLPFFDEARARRVRSVDCHAVGAGGGSPALLLRPGQRLFRVLRPPRRAASMSVIQIGGHCHGTCSRTPARHAAP